MLQLMNNLLEELITRTLAGEASIDAGLVGQLGDGSKLFNIHLIRVEAGHVVPCTIVRGTVHTRCTTLLATC